MLRLGYCFLPAPLLVLSCCFAFSWPLAAVTLNELKADPQLTPQRFASYFADFDFQFRAEVQSPKDFLAARCGDCDDYATLAAEVLAGKGYTPHLVAVRMKGIVHVVCYIEETQSYLDFNKRKEAACTVRSDGSLENIASQVAKSFRAPWTSASEFSYEAGLKRLVKTVLKNGLPSKENQVADLRTTVSPRKEFP
jgi:hypothetical protein